MPSVPSINESREYIRQQLGANGHLVDEFDRKLGLMFRGQDGKRARREIYHSLAFAARKYEGTLRKDGKSQYFGSHLFVVTHALLNVFSQEHLKAGAHSNPEFLKYAEALLKAAPHHDSLEDYKVNPGELIQVIGKDAFFVVSLLTSPNMDLSNFKKKYHDRIRKLDEEYRIKKGQPQKPGTGLSSSFSMAGKRTKLKADKLFRKSRFRNYSFVLPHEAESGIERGVDENSLKALLGPHEYRKFKNSYYFQYVKNLIKFSNINDAHMKILANGAATLKLLDHDANIRFHPNILQITKYRPGYPPLLNQVSRAAIAGHPIWTSRDAAFSTALAAVHRAAGLHVDNPPRDWRQLFVQASATARPV